MPRWGNPLRGAALDREVEVARAATLVFERAVRLGGRALESLLVEGMGERLAGDALRRARAEGYLEPDGPGAWKLTKFGRLAAAADEDGGRSRP